MQPDYTGLPGEDLVSRGLYDAAGGIESAEALLVAIGAPRLSRLGIRPLVPPTFSDSSELRLYRLLCREDSDTAHARFNSLVRRLVSFERALEQRQGEKMRSVKECRRANDTGDKT